MNNNIQQLRICAEKTLPEYKNKLSELKSSCNGSECQFAKLKAAFYTSKLWTLGDTIRIKFLEPPPSNLERTSINRILNLKDENGNLLKIDPLQKEVDNMNIIDAIMKIVTEHVQPFIGLNLIFVKAKENADIKISFDPNGGAWSFIGSDCRQTYQNEPTMNFGWFDVATTIHEFGHALGMIHEHQNPKGNTIQWDKQKVYNWASRTQGWDQNTTYRNIIEKYDSNQINGSDFDPNSIMLYFFPGSLTINNQGTHQNLRLSPYDVEYLNSIYPNNNSQKCGIISCQSPDEFYSKVYNENIKNSQPQVNPSSFETQIVTNSPKTQVVTGETQTLSKGVSTSLNSIDNILSDKNLTIILIIFSVGFLVLVVKDYIIPKNKNKKTFI